MNCKGLILLVFAISSCFAIIWSKANANIIRDVGIVFYGKNSVVENLSNGIIRSGASFAIVDLTNEQFSCNGYTSIVAIGYEAIRSVMNNCNNEHIVAIESENNTLKLKSEFGRDFNYVYVEQKPGNVIRDVSRHFPAIKTIGVLVESEAEKIQLSEAVKGVSASIIFKIVPDGELSRVSFVDLIDKTDAIFVTPNEKIWPHYKIKSFLLAGIRRGKVLIGGVSPQYIKAGVFAGTFTDFVSLGNEIGNKVQNGLKLNYRGYYEQFNFVYNKIIAGRISSLEYKE